MAFAQSRLPTLVRRPLPNNGASPAHPTHRHRVLLKKVQVEEKQSAWASFLELDHQVSQRFLRRHRNLLPLQLEIQILGLPRGFAKLKPCDCNNHRTTMLPNFDVALPISQTVNAYPEVFPQKV